MPTRDSDPDADLAQLRMLATRLPEIWNADATDLKLKQRIAKILIREVLLDVDAETNETVVVVHWSGGRHTELRVRRNRGHARAVHLPNAVEVVRKMAQRFSDLEIANTMNRARRGERKAGSAWTQERVRALRAKLDLPAYDPQRPRPAVVSRDQAALRLGICVGSVKVLIDRGVLPAEQVVPYAPWWIPEEALTSERVKTEVRAIVDRRPMNLSQYRERRTLKLPGIG